MSTAEIARRLAIRRATLVAWFQHEHYQDGRGWVQGEPRKYSEAVRERVIALKRAHAVREVFVVGH